MNILQHCSVRVISTSLFVILLGISIGLPLVPAAYASKEPCGSEAGEAVEVCPPQDTITCGSQQQENGKCVVGAKFHGPCDSLDAVQLGSEEGWFETQSGDCDTREWTMCSSQPIWNEEETEIIGYECVRDVGAQGFNESCGAYDQVVGCES